MGSPPWWVRMIRKRRSPTAEQRTESQVGQGREEGPAGTGSDILPKLIVGLGNPGPRYDATRHNVGWWAADRLVDEWGLGSFLSEGAALVARGSVASRPIVILKPTTYMNRSGEALAAFLSGRGIVPSRDLMVLVDDATRPPGSLRLRRSGGAGGHNGLKSLEALLGRDYPRLRIGVGRAPPGTDLAAWVLDAMPPDDEDRVLQAVDSIPDGLRVWLTDGLDPAMNRLNR